MSKTLVIYNEIPESVRFFLIPDDHNMVPLFEKVNTYYANLNIHDADGLTVEQVLDINSAYDDIHEYMFEWNNDADKFEGINPDMMQYQIMPGKLPAGTEISKIIEMGIAL